MKAFSIYSNALGHTIDIECNNENVTEEMVKEKIRKVEKVVYDIEDALDLLCDILPDSWEWNFI